MNQLYSLYTALQLRLEAARDDERGQTAAEYVGVLALIIVIAAALAQLAGADIANAIKDGVVAGVNKVTETVTGS